MKKFLFSFILIAFFACSSDDNGNQTMQEDPCNGVTTRPGLSVTLTDAANGQAITGDDAVVMVNEGGFSETLRFNTQTNSYTGVQDRSGNYVIIVESPAFQTFVSETIIVQEGEDCPLVVTQEVSISLEPSSN